MNATRFALAWVLVLTLATGAWAQEAGVWVQIEARPNLASATDRAQAYAADLPDVNGFSLGNGWYGIALGPYARTDADQVLRVYRAEGVIPADSYIALSSSFRGQFWPEGVDVLNRGTLQTPAVAPAPAPQTSGLATDGPTLSDETPAQAQRSERALSADERKALQIALEWAGTYSGAIDGAFGRGTRNSMERWQEQKGFESTGILTTQQRAVLLKDYNAVIADLDLMSVRDETAGIEIILPMAVVQFEKYQYPFSHYTSTGDIPATILLISQTGDEDSLAGLYDVMQTLDVVPLDGPRERKDTSFVLIGEDAMHVSETRVTLKEGVIKGYTVVWPAGDEERRRRLLMAMDKSFTQFDGVIPDNSVDAEDAIDLVAGLQVRQPRLSRSGFFVDSGGTVLTTTEAVQSCTRITIDEETDAELVVDDPSTGAAILRPTEKLAPQAVARFSDARPRLNAEVAASGYSFEGVLGGPSMTFGKLSDRKGLRGETDLSRLAMNTLPGDAGGPVLDAGGGVLGMLIANTDTGRALPDGVRFARDRETLQDLLSQAGLAGAVTDSSVAVDPIDLSTAATGMTVLVSCWD